MEIAPLLVAAPARQVAVDVVQLPHRDRPQLRLWDRAALRALLQVGSDSAVVTMLSTIAILIATINLVGGFTVTHSMLKMFQKDK